MTSTFRPCGRHRAYPTRQGLPRRQSLAGLAPGPWPRSLTNGTCEIPSAHEGERDRPIRQGFRLVEDRPGRARLRCELRWGVGQHALHDRPGEEEQVGRREDDAELLFLLARGYGQHGRSLHPVLVVV